MDTKKVVEHVFRNEYGKLLAIMVNKFGTHHLEFIEDALQEALLKAMKIWAYKEAPENPSAWLLKVAGNHLLDVLRRNTKSQSFESESIFLEETQIAPEKLLLETEINDNQLKMIFACCHPSLSQEYQLILSLKLVGGFGNRELAKALLKKEATIAKSFTRAKKEFKEKIKTLDIPIEMGLKSRLNLVLKVIYVLFTEGYQVASGETLIKKDICFEAIRLALLLLENKYCKQSDVHALIALMCFHAVRFDARIENSEIIDLENQDRSKYLEELIAIGDFHLNKATENEAPLSDYHFQAAIAYHHCVAKSFQETDWKTILEFYDLQLKQQYNPMIALNRIVAFKMVHNAKLALNELQDLESKDFFKETTLYYAIKSELLKDVSQKKEAISFLEKAIETTNNELEKKHFQKKLLKI